MFKTIGKIGAFVYCAAIVAVSVIFTIRDANRNLKHEAVIEAGNQIRIQDFFESCPSDARFVTDISNIDTTEPAVYQLKVFYDEAFEKDVVLRIEDHTAPKGIALPKSLYTTWKAPEAADCVGYLYDLSGIAKIEYEEEPVFKEGGDYNVPVLVTDVYGNTARIGVPFTVIDDRTAPVLTGVKDIEFSMDDEEPDFFDGVEATDDYDEDPVILIDDTKVDYENPGTYIVKYMAIDKAGNSTYRQAELKLTKSTKPASQTTATVSGGEDLSGGGSGGSGGSGAGTKEKAQQLARKVLSGLWGKDDVATARNIFNWVHSHIYYAHVPGRPSYAKACYRGFSRRSGDCYVYYACSKMLLDLAGIPNMMVRRYPVYGSNHYWNLVKLNGQWYHCDATVFKHRRTIYFMCTDKQINDKYHQFNGRLYPARAGGSTDFKPTDTPTPIPTETIAPTTEPDITPTGESSAITPSPEITNNPTITGGPTAGPTAEPTSGGTTVTPTPANTTTDTPSPTPVQTSADPSPSPTPLPTNTNTPVPTKPTEPTESKPEPTKPKPDPTKPAENTETNNGD